MDYFYYDGVVFRENEKTGHLERFLNGGWKHLPEHPPSDEEYSRMRKISKTEADKLTAA